MRKGVDYFTYIDGGRRAHEEFGEGERGGGGRVVEGRAGVGAVVVI